MKPLLFTVTPIWDAEAGVFYSDSDIIGLHVEAETIEDFVQAVRDHAPALVLENHLTKQDIAQTPLIELIPSILLRSPEAGPAAA